MRAYAPETRRRLPPARWIRLTSITAALIPKPQKNNKVDNISRIFSSYTGQDPLPMLIQIPRPNKTAAAATATQRRIRHFFSFDILLPPLPRLDRRALFLIVYLTGAPLSL